MTLPDPLPNLSEISCPGEDLIALAETLLPAYDREHSTESHIIALKLGRGNADWIATVSSRPRPLRQTSLL